MKLQTIHFFTLYYINSNHSFFTPCTLYHNCSLLHMNGLFKPLYFIVRVYIVTHIYKFINTVLKINILCQEILQVTLQMFYLSKLYIIILGIFREFLHDFIHLFALRSPCCWKVQNHQLTAKVNFKTWKTSCVCNE